MPWLQIIGIVLGCNGLFSVLLALLNRRWSKKDSMTTAFDSLKKDIKSVKDMLTAHIAEDRENDIRMARRDILRFNDEVRRGEPHTAESFDDILDQIDIYEKYCNDHPNFENNKAVLAIRNIKRVYQERLEKNDFL